MKSDLAIATLIRSRMTGARPLSRGFAKRLGYKNVAKGIRRIDALCAGDLEGTKQVFGRAAAILGNTCGNREVCA